MKGNSGIIGPRQKTDSLSSSGLYDTFDAYNKTLAESWSYTPKVKSIAVSSTNVDEGSPITVDITASGFDDGATLYWTINGVSGTVIADDFFPFSGNFTVSGTLASSTAQFAFGVSNDGTPDGTDVFNVQIRTGSTSGPVIATSQNITINDTSTEPVQELYSFINFTFYSCGVIGRLGPTYQQCISFYDTVTYPWLTNGAYYNHATLQGYQLWTVPADGDYSILAVGAAGGQGYGTYGTPGYGAGMTTTLSLTSGQQLVIIVGHQGGGLGTSSCGRDGGGGGGSFVFDYALGTCLLAAGGGGGGSNNGSNRDPTRRDAPNSTSGNNGSGTTGGVGGTGGNGGGVQSGSCVPGGGAGAGIFSGGAINGQSYASTPYSIGFTGGLGHANGWGGFGGGGGAGASYAAGGGGGYSGGGGGGLQTCSCADMGNGGGGGCYSSNPVYTYNAQLGTGAGYVTVNRL